MTNTMVIISKTTYKPLKTFEALGLQYLKITYV